MENLLTREEAAKFLGIKPQTLAMWHSKKTHNLPCYKVGRLVKYKKKDLINFIEENRK
jgi:excisionase family DNA binding protein